MYLNTAQLPNTGLLQPEHLLDNEKYLWKTPFYISTLDWLQSPVTNSIIHKKMSSTQMQFKNPYQMVNLLTDMIWISDQNL